jgi:hypothetical protein
MTYEEKERICAKLRHTVEEHGRLPESAVIVSLYEVDQIGGVKNITCPTIVVETLGGVSWEMARTFEDWEVME